MFDNAFKYVLAIKYITLCCSSQLLLLTSCLFFLYLFYIFIYIVTHNHQPQIQAF